MNRSVFDASLHRNGTSLFVPHPFNVLHCVADSRRKGKRVIVSLDQQWNMVVLLAPPGFGIVNCIKYRDHPSLISMQSTNADKTSVGFVAIGRHTFYPGTRRRRSRFRNLPAGPVSDCFLCIPQAFFYNDQGILFVVYHKLSRRKTSNYTLSELLQRCKSSFSFVTSAFESVKTVDKAESVEFIYTSQFVGPRHPDWNVKVKIFVEDKPPFAGIPFVEERRNPDSWTDRYIDSTTSPKAPIVIKHAKWLNDQGLVSRPNRTTVRKDSASIQSLELQRLQKRSLTPSKLYICRPRSSLAGVENYSTGCLMEYRGMDNCSLLLFVELTMPQSAYVDSIAKDEMYKHLSPKHYNAMLDHCLNQSRRSKIVIQRITVNGNTLEQTMICILLDNEPNPSGHGVCKLSSHVWTKTLEKTPNGVLDVTEGLAIQLLYQWPLEKILTLDHVKFIESAFPESGTKRYATKNSGFYQNLGDRSTTVCSASLGAHPCNKDQHQHWNMQFDQSKFPFVSKLRNELREQANKVSFSSGQILSATLKQAIGLSYQHIYEACLFSSNRYSSTRHRDADYMSLEDSEATMKHLKSFVNDDKIAKYAQKLQSFTYKKMLPQETTCCWTMVEHSNEYNFRQFFVNLTAGVALDISSDAFHISEQIGSTFLGATFDHSTSRPIWVRRNDGYISLNKPENCRNYPFAWGNHVERRRQRRTAAL